MTSTGVLTHRVDGAGQPLLLLNGGMMSIASWEPVAAPLARTYRVIRCDLRGQLLSPGEAHVELAGNVDDVVALLDRLEIGSAHVMGTSFGGEVGLLLATQRPERVRSLIAVTVTDRTTEAMRRGVDDVRRVVQAALAGGDKGRLHDLLVAEAYSPAFVEGHREELTARRAQIAAIPDLWFEGLGGILTVTEGLDLRSDVRRIRCPTLVVVAAGDRVMPPERSRALAGAIPGAEQVEHPTSGHALVAEDPAWLVERCREFLDRRSGAAAPGP